MADGEYVNNVNERQEKVLNLRPLGPDDQTERGKNFWNKSQVDMKFIIEKEWLKMVRFAKSKPNYGMQNLDFVIEELTGNKLELAGPIVDGYLREIALLMSSKLTRSRRTGLMSPIVLFIPYQIFRHVWVLVSVYGGNSVTTRNGEEISLTLEKEETAGKLWSPARFSGKNFLSKRNFEKVPKDGRSIFQYAGKSCIVVSKRTPIIMTFSAKQNRVTVTFYVQRYDKNGFAKDCSVQKLMNSTDS